MAQMAPVDDDGYGCFRRLIQELGDEHFHEAAQRLDIILNQMAWTTSSELVGELGLAIRDFLNTRPRMTPALRGTLKECKKAVNHVWGPFFFCTWRICL